MISKKLKTTIFLISISLISYTQENWNLEIDKNEIKVYSRKVKGFDFSETKSEMILNVKRSQFLQFIWKISKYPEWQDEYKEGKVLSINNNINMDIYFEFNAPWPIRNRDVIINMEQETIDNIVYIYIKTINSSISPKKDIIRISKYDGFWKIEEIGDKTKLTFEIHADPGGSIPNFLVEFYKATGPYNYFKNMRAELE